MLQWVVSSKLFLLKCLKKLNLKHLTFSSYSTPFDRESDASEADPNDIAKILKVKHLIYYYLYQY